MYQIWTCNAWVHRKIGSAIKMICCAVWLFVCLFVSVCIAKMCIHHHTLTRTHASCNRQFWRREKLGVRTYERRSVCECWRECVNRCTKWWSTKRINRLKHHPHKYCLSVCVCAFHLIEFSRKMRYGGWNWRFYVVWILDDRFKKKTTTTKQQHFKFALSCVCAMDEANWIHTTVDDMYTTCNFNCFASLALVIVIEFLMKIVLSSKHTHIPIELHDIKFCLIIQWKIKENIDLFTIRYTNVKCLLKFLADTSHWIATRWEDGAKWEKRLH